MYGDHDFGPMPDAGVMSTDLEKVWMDPEEQALYLQQCKPSSMYSILYTTVQHYLYGILHKNMELQTYVLIV